MRVTGSSEDIITSEMRLCPKGAPHLVGETGLDIGQMVGGAMAPLLYLVR